jgi:hypothetical protein
MTKRPLWASTAACLGALVTILAFQAPTWLNSQQTNKRLSKREMVMVCEASRNRLIRTEIWMQFFLDSEN